MVSRPNILQLTGIDRVLEGCRTAGISLAMLGSVSANPRCGEVQVLLDRARFEEIDGVLAVGGGSVIDAAKLLRVAYCYGTSTREALLGLDEIVRGPARSACYLLVVPTTAGTGAEVSQGAIITDEKDGRKLAARGRTLIPDEAIIDPELTLSLPSRRTAETGFDVMAHAVETYLSRAANPVTDILALAALRVVPSALVRAVEDGSDRQARTQLALYSWLIGYNLAHASTCLPHRMQYAIGWLTDTSHQLGLAALYPAWLRVVAARAGDRAATVDEQVRASLRQAGMDVSKASTLGDLFECLLARIGLRVTLRDLGIERSDIGRLSAAVDGRIDLDPVQPTKADIHRLFEESLGP